MTSAGTFQSPTASRAQSPSGEEELRFIRNFHDVFLSIGLAIFGVGLGLFSFLVAAEFFNVQDFGDVRRAGWIVAGIAFLDAAILWLIAEFFARSRRLFLPAIVILIGFVWFFAGGIIASFLTLFAEQNFDGFGDAAETLRFMPVTILGAVTVAIFAYYLRMKLPFAMGLGGVALTGTMVAGLATLNSDIVMSLGYWLQLFAGLFLFALGIYFDARDPARKTRLSDNGFWLHFFAAPLIFSATTSLATGGGVIFNSVGEGFGSGGNGSLAAIVTLLLVIFFSIVSLLINRRALLVSGLLSAAVAIAVLISETGLGGAWVGATTLLLLGSSMVLLGGGWHWVRRQLVAPFPKTGLIARIVPPEPAPGEVLIEE